ncbi:hypothetical protein Glove_173g25 [Diversispora epigaea]|uniref:ATP-dependent DNA helicase n=1 Tax=Diversispora epigaea TaxID=1348612 RepID=A0A397IYK6_9GLOM|nr:hypothetical protein Glove_173g25 [Diversispora epigaea]
MNYQLHNIYTFDNEHETLINWTNDSNSAIITDDPHNRIQSTQNQVSLSQLSYWRPSPKLQRLYDKFQNNTLKQWPQIACVYCRRLLYPEKACWIIYNPSLIYPLQQNISDITLSFYPGTNRRTPNSNAYFEYRSLIRTMNYSRNIRAHALYSGIIGAFLELTNNNSTSNESNDETLQRAATWLARNNIYLQPYTNILLSCHNLNLNNPFPQAEHIQTDVNTPVITSHEIIIPNNNFHNEIHNEDFHYSRLMADNVETLPNAHDLLQQSSYESRDIIDESKTFPLPTFMCDTYFHERQLHLNAILRKLGLPTLFITLSMAENRWTHLHKILATSFGEITDFFDRVEFQNRGATHTHSCYWTTNSIEVMIENNIIYSTVPDPLYEPELYSAVVANQIHTCNQRCNGPAILEQTCKKGFPRPFSDTTHYEEGNSRYVYKCLTEADSWVVLYHVPTLLIWNAHMNAQYITNKGFAKYIVKYIAKQKPSHIFNIHENDKLREYVVARRLGSMELMFLLLGHQICNSSMTVKFLSTEPPITRTRAILPIYMIDENDENPYYDDTITKYMLRPLLPEFNNLTYLQYFEKYSISPSSPPLTSHGELYFYQQLLLNVPARNETDYQMGSNGTYRKNSRSKWPYYFITGSAGTAYTNKELNTKLKEVDTLIIDKISMTSKKLFDFISNFFANLHQNSIAFGGINVIVVGDLFQLPLITGNDNQFCHMLEEIRVVGFREKLNTKLKEVDTLIIDKISMTSKKLFDFISNFFANLHQNSIAFGGINVIVVGDLFQLPLITGNDNQFCHMLEEIRVVGFRESAQQINRMICNMLPVSDNKFLISEATDTVNSEFWNASSTERMFKSKTNLLSYVCLQPGTCVIYFNNSLIEQGICNGTTGIITDIDLTEQSVRVAFSIKGAIIDIQVYKHTHYFEINGNNCKRTQFPLQNCFALTVHKTQGLTLPKVCLVLDGNIFSSGQAYVALSRCPTWNNIEISHLDRSAFITDPNVALEYQRLDNISRSHSNLFI